jgi:hypothetical protein
MNWYIDRLRLYMPDAPGDGGERLARLVGGGLAKAPKAAAGGHVEAITAKVTEETPTVTDELSRKIVAEILRQLNRSI